MDFLQSEEWRKFQEAVGRRTYVITGEGFRASVIEHKLPIVGAYFYVPRGPVITRNLKPKTRNPILELVELAKKENAGWIRFDAENEEILNSIKENLTSSSSPHQGEEGQCKFKIYRAPHDMQPKEVFVIDIAKSEEELLAEMKAKTRYNIKLAEQKGVRIFSESSAFGSKYLEEFLRLVKLTSKKQGITPHPEEYYRQMFEVIPEENIKLYVAEYDGKIIAANIVIFFGDTATYLHGASDSEYRNVMAPYLLQWKQICDAKLNGCTKYDFGGVKSHNANRITHNEKNDTRYAMRDAGNWSGITKFKTGFSPSTQPLEFFGSYDIVINPMKYRLYRIIQRAKSML